mgnify:FL=1
MLEIIQLAVLNDNYIYLIHDPVSGETAVIDPAVAQPVLDTLAEKNWSLNYILNTHHHHDHVGANLELKQKTNCEIFASTFDQPRIPGIDKTLNHGDEFSLGNQVARVIETPGHTLGHIVFYFSENKALFCGDTLFSMGCGRLFEGSSEQMWQSLQALKELPTDTQIYCAHEYTLANAKFALTLDPDNPALLLRIQQAKKLRAANQSTAPSSLKQELETNPFLREDSLAIQKSINMPGQSAADVFKRIRELKDSF